MGRPSVGWTWLALLLVFSGALLLVFSGGLLIGANLGSWL